MFKGYTFVDAQTVITTHLTEVIRDQMADLLSFSETQKLLDELPAEHQKLVADVVPQQISVGSLQRILQNLVAERVSIRDLPAILEGVAEATAYTRNISHNHRTRVRARLARQISHAVTNDAGYIPADHPVARLGAGLRRLDRRGRRGAPARHGADAASAVHHRGPAGLRPPRYGRRDAGPV